MNSFSTTGEIFDELEQLGKFYPAAALVILCSKLNRTHLIFASDGQPEARLMAINRLVATGARPVGFLAVNACSQIICWPLPNYKDRPEILKYLEEVEKQSRMTLIATAAHDDFAHA